MTKKTKAYMPHEYTDDGRDVYDYGFYKKMFIDDISLQVMPINLRSEKYKDVAISFTGNTSGIECARIILKSLNHHDNYNDDQIICAAVGNIAQYMLWFGDAIYEIHGEGKNIHLLGLRVDKILNLKIAYLQIAPQEHKIYKIRFLSKNDLWKISIPNKLQKQYAYKKIIDQIDKFQKMYPPFVEEELMKSGTNSFGFNLEEYRHKQFIYVNNLTKEWGWGQRSMPTDDVTEFFQNYKYLKIHLSRIILRDHIISELNKLFSKLNLNVEIVVKGLVNEAQMRQNIQDYISNKIPYENIGNLT